MKIWPFAACCLALCQLAGCVNDPMKSSRPFGKRVPVNTTPPPAAIPVIPVDGPEAVTSVEGVIDG